MSTPAPCPFDWFMDLTDPVPQWVGYTELGALPGPLQWSSAHPVPAIGSAVHIYLNDFGPATVTGYFHAEGFLGVICQPATLPAWYQRQNPGQRSCQVFGRELDPYRSGPAPQLPTQCSPDDWLPDYPEDADQTGT